MITDSFSISLFAAQKHSASLICATKSVAEFQSLLVFFERCNSVIPKRSSEAVRIRDLPSVPQRSKSDLERPVFRFIYHTQTHTPERVISYTRQQTRVPSAVFEPAVPAIKRLQTCFIERTATGIDCIRSFQWEIYWKYLLTHIWITVTGVMGTGIPEQSDSVKQNNPSEL